MFACGVCVWRCACVEGGVCVGCGYVGVGGGVCVRACFLFCFRFLYCFVLFLFFVLSFLLLFLTSEGFLSTFCKNCILMRGMVYIIFPANNASNVFYS